MATSTRSSYTRTSFQHHCPALVSLLLLASRFRRSREPGEVASTSLAMRRLVCLSVVLLATGCSAKYKLVDDYRAGNFFDMFSFFDGADPTNGTVSYVPGERAAASGLINATGSTVKIGVDSNSIVADKRQSVRITSNSVYNKGLLVVDIKHMPAGCGTWPALWMLGQNAPWPVGGEMDIMEGVNDQAQNSMALHTSPDCSIAGSEARSPGEDGRSPIDFTGYLAKNTCDFDGARQDYVGCVIRAPNGTSRVYAGSGMPKDAAVPTFGDDFNRAGGGIVAMEWTSLGFKIWFFGRGQAVPGDVASAANLTSDAAGLELDPGNANWGTPVGQFAGEQCNWDARFKDMAVIVNTGLCGAWAGKTWSTDGDCRNQTGAATCEDFVRRSPDAFEQAYWEFGAFRWFEAEPGDRESGRNTPRPSSILLSTGPPPPPPSLPSSETELPSPPPTGPPPLPVARTVWLTDTAMLQPESSSPAPPPPPSTPYLFSPPDPVAPETSSPVLSLPPGSDVPAPPPVPRFAAEAFVAASPASVSAQAAPTAKGGGKPGGAFTGTPPPVAGGQPATNGAAVAAVGTRSPASLVAASAAMLISGLLA